MARVLLIPGWATTARVWDKVRAALPPEITADTIEWWDALDGGANGASEGAVVVGWSLGSLCALRMALGGKPRSVVFVAGTPRFLEDQDHPGAAPVALRAMRRRIVIDREACQDDFFTSALAPARDEKTVDALCCDARAIPVETLVRGLDFLARTDLRAEAGRLAMPLGVVHGEEDRIVPHAAATRCAATVPGSTCDVLPGLGHALPLLAPQQVAAAIVQCVNACS